MKILLVFQIIISIFLIISILLQQRGSGVSSIFGGEGGYYFKKRGIEKFLFFSTIFLSVAFIALSLLNFLK